VGHGPGYQVLGSSDVLSLTSLTAAVTLHQDAIVEVKKGVLETRDSLRQPSFGEVARAIEDKAVFRKARESELESLPSNFSSVEATAGVYCAHVTV
jgi:hypothetical protein